MTLEIREWLIETEDGFDFRHSVNIYPDNNKVLRDNLFFDVVGEAAGLILTNKKIE